MKAFLDDNFLLTTPTAQRLYGMAEKMPILDYHCHLTPRRSPRTGTLKTSPRCGWAVTTTSGG